MVSRSRARQFGFGLATILLTVVAVEAIAWLGGSLHLGRPASWSAWERQRDAVRREVGAPTAAAMPEEGPRFSLMGGVLHPYVGYVADPDQVPEADELGFKSLEGALQRRAPDRIVVAVVGGSVAEGFAVYGMPHVARSLEASSRYAGRRFVTVNLGFSGYKQPQQLTALGYLLALGAEFDVVINIDGFNEVALHATENALKGVFPAYPQAWFLFADRAPDPERRQLIGEREELARRIPALADRYSRFPLRASFTANVVWSLHNQALLRRHARLGKALNEQQSLAAELVSDRQVARDRVPYRIRGPRIERATDLEELVSMWREGSRQLDRLCRANGIRYFHFLQPNQYVAGSKPMGADERRRAVNPAQRYRPGVEQGYPLLSREGNALAREGVRFADLTGVFAEVKAPLYIDDCCHFSAEGYEIMARHVTRALLDGGDARERGDAR